MFEAPPPIEEGQPGTITASISITREPVGCEPFISFEYKISLRIFCIALALSRLERTTGRSNTSETEQNAEETVKEEIRKYAREERNRGKEDGGDNAPPPSGGSDLKQRKSGPAAPGTSNKTHSVIPSANEES